MFPCGWFSLYCDTFRLLKKTDVNLIHINASYKPAYVYGGTTFSVSLLCESLVATRNNVTVLTTTANGKDELPAGSSVTDGVPVIYFNRLTKDHSHFSPALLSALLKMASQTQVVHIHAWWNLVSILSVMVCRFKSAKHVLSPRGMFSNYSFTPARRKFQKWIGRRLLGRAHFHATSKNEEAEIRALFPSARITVIPNMVNLPAREIEKTDHVGNNLVFLSRIDPKKGIELLIRSLPGLGHEYHLDIIGSGSEEYIQQLKSIGSFLAMDNRISWRGSLFNDDKFNALASADLLVLPSYNENFANIVIEALSVGTPVVVSKHVGLAGFIIEHDLGWVCDTTAESLTATIKDAVEDNAKRERIQKKAPQLVREHFSPAALVDQYLNMYQHV